MFCRYGISYHGAAQAASGTKEQVTSYREKSKKLFQSIGQFTRSNRDAESSSVASDIANINDIGVKPKQQCMANISSFLPLNSQQIQIFKLYFLCECLHSSFI